MWESKPPVRPSCRVPSAVRPSRLGLPEERMMREKRIMEMWGSKPPVRPSRRVPSAVRPSRLGLSEERKMREKKMMRVVGINAVRPSEPHGVVRRPPESFRVAQGEDNEGKMDNEGCGD